MVNAHAMANAIAMANANAIANWRKQSIGINSQLCQLMLAAAIAGAGTIAAAITIGHFEIMPFRLPSARAKQVAATLLAS
jgi:hypothetical protein